MNLSAYSLKTGVFATLVFVLVLAMLLLDIVMIKMAEQDMIHAEKKKGLLLLRSVEQTLTSASEGDREPEMNTASPFFRGLPQVLDKTDLSALLIVGVSGTPVFETSMAKAEKRALSELAMQSINMGRDVSDLSTWGALPFLPLKRGYLALATPIRYKKRIRPLPWFLGLAASELCRPCVKTEDLAGSHRDGKDL